MAVKSGSTDRANFSFPVSWLVWAIHVGNRLNYSDIPCIQYVYFLSIVDYRLFFWWLRHDKKGEIKGCCFCNNNTQYNNIYTVLVLVHVRFVTLTPNMFSEIIWICGKWEREKTKSYSVNSKYVCIMTSFQSLMHARAFSSLCGFHCLEQKRKNVKLPLLPVCCDCCGIKRGTFTQSHREILIWMDEVEMERFPSQFPCFFPVPRWNWKFQLFASLASLHKNGHISIPQWSLTKGQLLITPRFCYFVMYLFL